MKTLIATRYVTPLREGGSLPAVVETEDGRLFVVKFRGAGQGVRALVAELIVGELARACGFRVPELAIVTLDEALGRNEPDAEIRDLLRASIGRNLGLAYLPGAIAFDPIAPPVVDERLASDLVWFDAFVLNVDRTPRNPNLLLWEGALWLIDHGAALYFHHAWESAESAARSPFPLVKDHVLLPRAADLGRADARMRERLAAADRTAILAAVPDEWLSNPQGGSPAQVREAYDAWFSQRLEASTSFLEEAERARAQFV